MRLSDVKKLATAFEQSDWDEVHLVVDGVEIHISTDPAAASAAQVASASVVTPAGAPAPRAAPRAPSAGPSAEPVNVGLPAQPELESGIVVESPTPGIFWRSPSPGAPPFVEVGQRVAPDTTVCVVEVMKLMQRVSAGVAGTIVSILVANAGPVEKGQPLVVVAEDGYV